jgi:hypothetical protein
VLWVLAIGSYWTFAHRMYHTWREVNRVEAESAAAAIAAEKASNASPEKRHPEPDFARQG